MSMTRKRLTYPFTMPEVKSVPSAFHFCSLTLHLRVALTSQTRFSFLVEHIFRVDAFGSPASAEKSPSSVFRSKRLTQAVTNLANDDDYLVQTGFLWR